MSDPRFFAVQRTNSRDLEPNHFTRVLALDVTAPDTDRRRLLAKLDSTVQVNFTTNMAGLDSIDYTIDLRLSRLFRGDTDTLTTVTLKRSFVPGATQTSFSELLNLTWTDCLRRRRRGECYTSEDDGDLEISNCRDRDCGNDNNENVRYSIAVRFTPNSPFSSSNLASLTASNRSLNAVVFPADSGGRERRGFDFFL